MTRSPERCGHLVVSRVGAETSSGLIKPRLEFTLDRGMTFDHGACDSCT
jgi:hypothetical protein